MLEKFKEVSAKRHQYAQDWKKRTGKKALGYLCTYTPEEIIYAADILPVRILGSHEAQDVTEPHIYTMFCPLSRDCLAQGLKGRYDYLDGLATTASCIHMRQCFNSWVLNVKTPFYHYVVMPAKVQSQFAKPFLTAEFQIFKDALEKWSGKKISDEALDKAIKVYNTNRRLMKQVYEMRKSDPPAISGTEAMEIVLSSMFSDKAEHNQWLEKAIKEIPLRKDKPKSGTRLMIISSVLDNLDFMDLVEKDLSANIVIDDVCTGSRYFWNEVPAGKNRIEALAERYIERPPCPVKDWEARRRYPYILGLAKEYNVQGAIIVQQKFCDPHEFDIPPIMELLKKNNIPSIFLEFDITVPVGQFRTRIEAFLEMLQLELV